MKLTDLDPRWITMPNWSSKAPYYIGVSFLCPCAKCHAAACPTCGHRPEAKRLAVKFFPHIDPQNIAQSFALPVPDLGEHRRLNGDTFDTLTLNPSVGFESIGHWHGHISNGEVTSS